MSEAIRQRLAQLKTLHASPQYRSAEQFFRRLELRLQDAMLLKNNARPAKLLQIIEKAERQLEKAKKHPDPDMRADVAASAERIRSDAWAGIRAMQKPEAVPLGKFTIKEKIPLHAKVGLDAPALLHPQLPNMAQGAATQSTKAENGRQPNWLAKNWNEKTIGKRKSLESLAQSIGDVGQHLEKLGAFLTYKGTVLEQTPRIASFREWLGRYARELALDFKNDVKTGKISAPRAQSSELSALALGVWLGQRYASHAQHGSEKYEYPKIIFKEERKKKPASGIAGATDVAIMHTEEMADTLALPKNAPRDGMAKVADIMVPATGAAFDPKKNALVLKNYSALLGRFESFVSEQCAFAMGFDLGLHQQVHAQDVQDGLPFSEISALAVVAEWGLPLKLPLYQPKLAAAMAEKGCLDFVRIWKGLGGNDRIALAENILQNAPLLVLPWAKLYLASVGKKADRHSLAALFKEKKPRCVYWRRAPVKEAAMAIPMHQLLRVLARSASDPRVKARLLKVAKALKKESEAGIAPLAAYVELMDREFGVPPDDLPENFA